jgi:small subunit ribosomal protein S27e
LIIAQKSKTYQKINQYLYKQKTFLILILRRGLFMVKVKEPTSKFVKVRCPKCKNEQIMFGKAATDVKCLVCGKVIAEPTGGKSKIKARILEVLE